ncbi:MAG: glycosyltransferase family 39 protein [Bacteroidia bacterium]|nr:glycosyltransferase family 39 protein [Bacteroidia bacterium]
MIQWIEDHPIWTIIGAVGAMLLLHLDMFQITIMEARNFVTAREMIDDGNWLLTTMNGEPRYEKPPLPTWLSAFFAGLFGLKNLYAYRLPAVLLVILTGVMTYLLSYRILEDKVQSLLNGLIVITSFYVVGIILEAPWDIFTHGFMLVAIYFLIRLFGEPSEEFKHAIWAGIFLGFSFLSKGPISMYALLLPFLIAYGWVYGYSGFRGKVMSVIIGLALFVSTGLWWYIYVRFQDPLTFEAIASKETSNWANYNVKPIYHYWSFFIQSGLWTIPALIGLMYPYMKTRVLHLKAYRFTILWTIFSVVLLSLVPEKKNRYLMPVLIPLAMNSGFYFEYIIREFTKVSRVEKLPIYIHFAVVCMIGIALPIAGYFFFWGQIQGYEWVLGLTSLASALIGMAIFRSLLHSNIKSAFYQSILFMVALVALGTPLSKTFQSGTFQPIPSHQKMTDKVHYYEKIAPEFVWYYGQPILSFDPEKQLEVLSNDGLQVLVDMENLESFEAFVVQDYQIEVIKSYNLNRMSRQRDRLIAHLYQVRTKE